MDMEQLEALTGLDHETVTTIGVAATVIFLAILIIYWIAKFALDADSRGNDLGCLLKLLMVGALMAVLFILVLGWAGWPFGADQ